MNQINFIFKKKNHLVGITYIIKNFLEGWQSFFAISGALALFGVLISSIILTVMYFNNNPYEEVIKTIKVFVILSIIMWLGLFIIRFSKKMERKIK